MGKDEIFDLLSLTAINDAASYRRCYLEKSRNYVRARAVLVAAGGFRPVRTASIGPHGRRVPPRLPRG